MTKNRNTLILTVSAMLVLSTSLAFSRDPPQADLRDAAMMIIGHQLCNSVSLERVAIVTKRAAEREGIPFNRAKILLRRIHTDLVAEIRADPAKARDVCWLVNIMDKQIP